ncbi:MAG: DUF2779 domain-containing protein [Nanoarchaeota archaeon]|nr:DUF2779 domain-containing protein [Nanoarchaeota archaeon]
MLNRKLLTKSRYVTGLSCKKAIWLAFNKPEALPEIDEATQHRFDEGHKVGELSKSLFPDGIDIQEMIPIENDKKSRELIKKRKPLFEAGFLHRDSKCYARADILVPVEKKEWDIIEVKSATSVKEDYLEDISFQKYCYESAGLKIRKCFVLHINNQYVRQGEIEPKEFFVQANVTNEIEDLLSDVPAKIKKLFSIISLKKCPEITPKDHCCLGDSDAYKRFEVLHESDAFWKEHPECDIFDLYRGGKKMLELFKSGVLTIKDIPKHHKLNDKQLIQHKTHSSGKHHHDKEELDIFVKSLQYPLYFLDFESYNTAIPLYDGLKPYQQLIFQFSLHVIGKKGAKPKHYSFIAEGADDPRPAFAKELKKVLRTKGNIVVYNQSFEKTRLKELATYLPQYASWVEQVVERMVDLLVPFRNFAYYHPKQKGSASIKYVLPVLTGATYEDFEIANGAQASLEYLFITHGSYKGEKATPEEVKKVRSDLEKYCGQDTEGMIWILDKLKELIK